MQHTLTPSISRTGRASNNEDAAWTWSAMDPSGRSVSVLAVADGMGGHEYGEKSSEIAIRALEEAVEDLVEAVQEETDSDLRSEYRRLYGRIDSALRIYGEEHSEVTEMGTTLVVAVLVGQQAHIAHIGDSRAYWVSEGGNTTQLTQDHSAAAEAVREGRMTEEEAAKSPYRHALTRCLDGSGESEPDFVTRSIQDPGFLCLCSDGLSGPVDDEDFARVLLRDVPLAHASESLVDRAYENGSKDNITLAVVEVGVVDRERNSAVLPPREVPGRNREQYFFSTLASRLRSSEGGAPRWAVVLLGVSSLAFLVLSGVYVYENNSLLSGVENGIATVFGADADSTNTETPTPHESQSQDPDVSENGRDTSQAAGMNQQKREKLSDGQNRKGGTGNTEPIDRNVEAGESSTKGRREVEKEEYEREDDRGTKCKVVFAVLPPWKSGRARKFKNKLEEASGKLSPKIKSCFGDKKCLVPGEISIGNVESGEKLSISRMKDAGVYEVVSRMTGGKDQHPYKHCFLE